MIVESVILSLIVGFFRKGNFLNFGVVKVKGASLFIVGALIQFLLFRFASLEGFGWPRVLGDHLNLIHGISYMFILTPFLLNLNYKSMYLMMIGTMLNFTVIVANYGQMPVDLPSVYSPTFDLGHTLLTQATRVKILGDIIFIGPPYPMPKVISIGDIFLIIGVFSLIQQVLMDRKLKGEVEEIRASESRSKKKLTDL